MLQCTSCRLRPEHCAAANELQMSLICLCHFFFFSTSGSNLHLASLPAAALEIIISETNEAAFPVQDERNVVIHHTDTKGFENLGFNKKVEGIAFNCELIGKYPLTGKGLKKKEQIKYHPPPQLLMTSSLIKMERMLLTQFTLGYKKSVSQTQGCSFGQDEQGALLINNCLH